jgi:hypothetical protein
VTALPRASRTAIIAAFASGATAEEAAKAGGTSRRTLYLHLRADAVLQQAVAIARAKAPPKAGRPKAAGSAAREHVDARPPVSAERIAVALPAAAAALETALETAHPKFVGHASWTALRSAFHVLPDAVRREAIARLLLEEADRVERDASLVWGPVDRHARVGMASGG